MLGKVIAIPERRSRHHPRTTIRDSLPIYFLVFHRWLIARSEIHVAPAHLFHRAIAFVACCKPVLLGPFAADQILERIGRAQLHSNSEWQLLRQWASEIVIVANGHDGNIPVRDRSQAMIAEVSARVRSGHFLGHF
jgi:hypothetical protein